MADSRQPTARPDDRRILIEPGIWSLESGVWSLALHLALSCELSAQSFLKS